MKQHSLDILLRPRSIAFVGASDRPNSTGAAMLAMCLIDGFDGKIFSINPRLSTLNGGPCYADLKALPEVPDHVVIGVASRFVNCVVSIKSNTRSSATLKQKFIFSSSKTTQGS